MVRLWIRPGPTPTLQSLVPSTQNKEFNRPGAIPQVGMLAAHEDPQIRWALHLTVTPFDDHLATMASPSRATLAKDSVSDIAGWPTAAASKNPVATRPKFPSRASSSPPVRERTTVQRPAAY